LLGVPAFCCWEALESGLRTLPQQEQGSKLTAVLAWRKMGMLMREAVLMGRATRISSPHGCIGEETGIDALFDGPAPGFDDNGNEDSDLLAPELD
jgi:hypothetical protein